MLDITVHFYGALAAVAMAAFLFALWRRGHLPPMGRPFTAVLVIGLLTLGLLGNGQQGAMTYRLAGGLYPILLTPAGADAAETAVGWMLEQAFIDRVAALPDHPGGCVPGMDAETFRARVIARQWRYRDATERFGITISPPPPDDTRLVVIEYVDVQNWFFSLFDGDAVDRRQFCLAQLNSYETALQIVALLTTTQDAAVQERALTVLGGERIEDIGPWIHPRLAALTGTLASLQANTQLAAQVARVTP